MVEAAVMMKFYDLRKRLCEERDISDLHCSGPGDDAGTVQITAFTRRIEVRPGSVNILTFSQLPSPVLAPTTSPTHYWYHLHVRRT